MKIVLDSNAIFGDFWLSHPEVRVLERYLSWTQDELCIPEIVFEEIVRHFRRNHQKQVKLFLKLAKPLHIIINTEEAKKINNIEDLMGLYRDNLTNRVRELNARILPLPDADLRELFMRDLNERKPFNSSGKGFRDTLIWESILKECAKHTEDLAFITNDTDFVVLTSDGDVNIELHQDLILDLAKAGYSPDRISIQKDLQSFNEEFALPLVNRVYREGEEIKGTFIEQLEPANMLERYGYAAVRAVDENLPQLLESRLALVDRVSFIRWPEKARIIEAYDLLDNLVQVLIRTTIVFDAEIAVDQDEHDQITKFISNKPVDLLTITWNESNGMFYMVMRISVEADFVFHWNTELDAAQGFLLRRIVFDESKTG